MLLSIEDLRRLHFRDAAETLGQVTDCEVDLRTWSVVALTMQPASGTVALRVPVGDVEIVDTTGESLSLVGGSRARTAAPVTGEEAEAEGTIRASQLEGQPAMATDGQVGPVEELVLETGTWRVGYLVLDARRWLPGHKVMVRPDRVSRWDGSLHLDLSRDRIRSAGRL